MEIAPNTVQLGMFPVDRADFEEIKEYLTTFGLTPKSDQSLFLYWKDWCKNCIRHCKSSQCSKK